VTVVKIGAEKSREPVQYVESKESFGKVRALRPEVDRLRCVTLTL